MTRVIRFAALKEAPWKNGGGTTTEILVSPEGAGFEDFDWRLSVARVASDGPFSRFEGIDRTLTVIEGAGINLAIEGRGEALLTPATAPFAFPGDVPVSARLMDGPIRDLNVMTRRGRLVHRVSRISPGATIAPAEPTLVVALDDVTLKSGGETICLGFGDVAVLETACQVESGTGLSVALRPA